MDAVMDVGTGEYYDDARWMWQCVAGSLGVAMDRADLATGMEG